MTSPYPIATIIGVLVIALSIASGLIWLERRLLGLWQDRYGPNRVGPFGLLQVVADMIKIFTKEDWIPPFADKPVFVLAPAIIVVTVLMTFAVLPIAPGIIVYRLEHRTALLPCHVLFGGLQRGACGLVIGQQVFTAGGIAGGSPNDQLRSLHGSIRNGSGGAGRFL